MFSSCVKSQRWGSILYILCLNLMRKHLNVVFLSPCCVWFVVFVSTVVFVIAFLAGSHSCCFGGGILFSRRVELFCFWAVYFKFGEPLWGFPCCVDFDWVQLLWSCLLFLIRRSYEGLSGIMYPCLCVLVSTCLSGLRGFPLPVRLIWALFGPRSLAPA